MNETPPREETDLPLLQETQEYLRELLDDKIPDSMLAASWDEFYRLYSALIRRFVVSRGVRGGDVDDCLQEVWSEVATRLVDFDRPPDRPGLRAWLYALVRSKTTDLFRKKQRDSAHSIELAVETGHEPADQGMTPAEKEEREWKDAVVATLLEELQPEISAENFRIVQLRLIERQPAAQVAEELGMSADQVRYRQHRLMKKLRARLAAYTGGATD
mgnify:CR=1 FL=1